MRWAGDADLLAGADYLRNRPDVDEDRIGAIGFSIGGEQLLEAAARSTTIRAVVSEGAGGRVGETDASGLFRRSSSLDARDDHRGDRVPEPRFAPRIEERIGLIAPRSVFLIYAVPGIGEEDIRQPTFYAAAGEPKAMWRVPGSEHTGGIEAQPAEYERRVIEFVDRRCWIAGDLREGMEIGVQPPRMTRSGWRIGTGSPCLDRGRRSSRSARVVALHVADDNFLSRSRDVGGRPPRQRPRPARRARPRRVGYPRLRAGLRATLALFLGGRGRDRCRGRLLRPRARSRATTSRARDRGGGAVGRHRDRDPLEDETQGRQPCASLSPSAPPGRRGGRCPVRARDPVLRVVRLHARRTRVRPPPELGAAHEEVSFTTSESPARGLVRALEEPRGDHRLCRAAGFTAADADARPPRIRRPPFDRRGEGESEGDPNIFGWQGERDVHAAVDYLVSRADVDPDRIGASGSLGGRRDDDRGGRRVGRPRRDRLRGAGFVPYARPSPWKGRRRRSGSGACSCTRS